jgi:hypothetical protein
MADIVTTTSGKEFVSPDGVWRRLSGGTSVDTDQRRRSSGAERLIRAEQGEGPAAPWEEEEQRQRGATGMLWRMIMLIVPTVLLFCLGMAGYDRVRRAELSLERKNEELKNMHLILSTMTNSEWNDPTLLK